MERQATTLSLDELERRIHAGDRFILRAPGAIEFLPSPLRTMAEIEKAIGAAITDSFMLRHLGWPPIAVIVDDHGYETTHRQEGSTTHLVPVRALKPVNELATALYWKNCQPGTTHKIVGDVYIAPDADFEAMP